MKSKRTEIRTGKKRVRFYGLAGAIKYGMPGTFRAAANPTREQAKRWIESGQDFWLEIDLNDGHVMRVYLDPDGFSAYVEAK